MMAEASDTLKNLSYSSSKEGEPSVEAQFVEESAGATSREHESRQSYLKGFRLYTITAVLSLCLFLTNIEIPIVTTALVSITNDLGAFDRASWVISAYLLGYVSVLIIFSKLSDVFGRKFTLLAVVLIFAIFSGACGASQTIEQLIVFRAFQGVGGAGTNSLATVILIELVPSEKYAKYTSAVSLVYSLSLLLGPILGGVISQYATWRWIFLINVPSAVAAAVVLFLTIPNGFPYHGVPRHERPNGGHTLSRASLRRIDYIGTTLLLLSTLSIVAALEEAGLRFPWKSAYVITLLIIAGVGWTVFLLWERRVTLHAKVQEPVFPWRFVQSRVWVGMLLTVFFLGAPFFATNFQLPQRLQIVNGLSPTDAGVRVIPFTLAAPFGSVLAPIVCKVGKVPPIYLVIFAAIVQVIGFSLISTLPYSKTPIAAQYGYEIIAGFGCGINITLLILMTPFSVQARDKAVALGTITQFRVMGGAIGLAIVTAVFNSLVRSQLGEQISSTDLSTLLTSPATITTFPPDVQETIRVTFADGYALQAKVLAGLAAGQIPASLLMWQAKQIVV
ncbi:MFS multidrug transporter-like protein [Xylaria cubensis]|nr:MFS multidrug transporter-like protein [Xylaria cubensis]